MSNDRVTIRPATVADLPAVSNAHLEAQNDFHDFYGLFFQHDPREIVPLLTRKAFDNTAKFNFLVAEQEGQVLGFVRYSIVEAISAAPHHQQDNEKKEGGGKDTTVVPEPPSLLAPKEHLKDLWDRFNERQGSMDECAEKAIRGRRHYLVQHLMVHPQHQRKGVGAQLLQKVLDKADAEGAPTLLTSSIEGYGLYSRLGFVPMEQFTIDNGYWTREVMTHLKKLGLSADERLIEKYDNVKEVEAVMIREPRP